MKHLSMSPKAIDKIISELLSENTTSSYGSEIELQLEMVFYNSAKVLLGFLISFPILNSIITFST